MSPDFADFPRFPAQRFPVLIDFSLPEDVKGEVLKIGSQATVVVYTGDHWLLNKMAQLLIRLSSLLSYAY
ncbi:MAG: hypothetical protein KKD01_20150 [Proteobacteria bacterium]|nr:hypothetical protein [Pseudomonadota bacterium]